MRPELLNTKPWIDAYITPSLSPYNGSTEHNGQSMKRTLGGMAKAGEPLLREALDAIRAHQTAQDNGASPDTIEWLRVLADSLRA